MRPDEAKPLNPGLLRHQLVWQKKVVSGQDSFGADVYEWVQFVLVKAQIKSLTGRELQEAQQRWGDAEYQITQHYIKGLLYEMRGSAYIDGRVKYFDILDIQDTTGMGVVQRIIAREWTAGQVAAAAAGEAKTIDEVADIDAVSDWDTLQE